MAYCYEILWFMKNSAQKMGDRLAYNNSAQYNISDETIPERAHFVIILKELPSFVIYVFNIISLFLGDKLHIR